MRFVCVCVYVRRPRESPSALFARYLCLVTPLRAPSHGIFILLSVVSHCSLYTHIHSQNAHTRTVKVVYQYIWMSLFAT